MKKKLYLEIYLYKKCWNIICYKRIDIEKINWNMFTFEWEHSFGQFSPV